MQVEILVPLPPDAIAPTPRTSQVQPRAVSSCLVLPADCCCKWSVISKQNQAHPLIYAG